MIDWDKHQRHIISIQNRKIKGFHALVTMDQLEQKMLNETNVYLATVRIEEVPSNQDSCSGDGTEG